MSESKSRKIMLHEHQIQALIDWANEGDREGGTTAWGPKFNAVMKVAQEVRDGAATLDAVDNIFEMNQ